MAPIVLGFLLLAFSTPTLTQKKIVCYFSSWAVYRTGDGLFDTSFVDPKLCTHLIYAFISAYPNGSVKILDPSNDIKKNGYSKFNNLRLSNPTLKTMVSIGGWISGSKIFSDICNNSTLRAKFVTNLYNFVVRYKFNGLDLDWEYPVLNGGIAADKANYVSLIKELRAKFTSAGLILSAAVSASESATTTSYDVPALSANLDFINLMIYDFHGFWDGKTGHNSPLYGASSHNLYADAAVKNWIKLGASKTKLVLGIPLYGRSFTLSNIANTQMGAATSGAGTAGSWSQEAGLLMYSEICTSQKSESDWNVVWDATQAVPYAHRNNQWVGYENVISIGIKGQYARDQGLGGVMVWAIDMDDFRDLCGDGKYPLLTNLKTNFTARERPTKY